MLRCRLVDQVPGQQGFPQNQGTFKPFPDEYFDDSINSHSGLAREQRDAMWRTKNYPACMFFRPGRPRSPSIKIRDRRLQAKLPDGVMSTSQAQTVVASKAQVVKAVTLPSNVDRIFDHVHPQDLNNEVIIA